MSNVKVNGNTYNGVTSIKLALADGTGYAEYSEGAQTTDVTNSILDGSFSGDYANAEILAINLGCLSSRTVGTLSFPNATKMFGSANGVTAVNIYLPRVSKIDDPIPTFKTANISGVLDLSGLLSTITAMNQTFYGATIGTLKIGNMPQHNGCMQNATITNLVWSLADASRVKTAMQQATAIANAYVADDIYDAVQAFITDGSLTKVTNLHKISEWSDD